MPSAASPAPPAANPSFAMMERRVSRVSGTLVVAPVGGTPLSGIGASGCSPAAWLPVRFPCLRFAGVWAVWFSSALPLGKELKPGVQSDLSVTTEEQEAARERFGLLLAAILLSVLAEGTLPQSEWKQAIVTVLLGGTLLLAFSVGQHAPPPPAARGGRGGRGRSRGAGLALVVGNGHVITGAVAISNGLLVALAPPAVVVGVVRSLRTRRVVTIEAVMGALCLYLLAGMFFAFVYGAIENLGGDPFFANAADWYLAATRSTSASSHSRPPATATSPPALTSATCCR